MFDLDLKQVNKQTNNNPGILNKPHTPCSLRSLVLWPPGGPWPLVWQPVAFSSRISQASCPQRPWALDADTRPDPRVATIRHTEGIWTALGVYMCLCCSFSWTTVELVQIWAAVLFVCVCACLYGQFFPGVNCWSSTNGRCWGAGLRAVVCSWNICLCFSWVKLWSGAGSRGGGNRGEELNWEETEEEKEDSV